MKQSYDHKKIEKKWQKVWEQEKLYQADIKKSEDKYYCLDMFPYPSGEGLHVGHWRGYVLSDYYARYWRLKGKNVLHPMGFDAFGLPAENAAIKNKSHPKEYTDQAVATFTRQLKAIGASFDWSKVVNTSSPQYYQWTQWLFLQLFKHGLAEKRVSQVNWCPKDKTVLANEQVIAGKCDRCGSTVTKKDLNQWYLKITEFAQELLEDLDDLDWPEHVKTLQRNWIGRSVGASVVFDSPAGEIEVFTTRADTLFGVTALVLAPEHPNVAELTSESQKKLVKKFVERTLSQTDVARSQARTTEKSAISLGTEAIHPLTKKKIPIWIADYVLGSYGTGAVMFVPAHDERDYQIATAYNIKINRVILSNKTKALPFTEEGTVTNSGEFDGLSSQDAAKEITKKLVKVKKGGRRVEFRIRDWLVSRQRYWGAPIPIVYDPKDQPHAVEEKHLPLLLPTDVNFLPGGESPIARSKEYQKRAEKLYGKGWHFETDTLDTFVDSSWYFLRYLSPTDSKQAFDKKLVDKWLPVDLYIGGIEHAILHLLYSRFVCHFLAKFEYIQNDMREPFKKLFNIGMVNLHGSKMSKSKGNVVSADELVEYYGTDTLRGYELFIGPLELEAEWNSHGINGIHRFLIKVFQLTEKVKDHAGEPKIEREFSKYLASINEMVADLRLNTVISEAMKFQNFLDTQKTVSKKLMTQYLITLSPVFPFLAEELYSQLGHQESIFKDKWPEITHRSSEIRIKILINQKFAGELVFKKEPDKDDVLEMAREDLVIAGKLKGNPIKKTFYQPGKVLNIVV